MIVSKEGHCERVNLFTMEYNAVRVEDVSLKDQVWNAFE